MELLQSGEPRRRSSRQAQRNVLFGSEVKPRAALKRRRETKQDGQLINGSEKGTADEEAEESPSKISKLQEQKEEKENEDKNIEMEPDMSDLPDQEQDMNSEGETENCEISRKAEPLIKEKSVIRTLCVGNLETEEIKFLLTQRMEENHPKPPRVVPVQDKSHGSLTSSRATSRTSSAPVRLRPLENSKEVLIGRRSIKQYRDKMEEKAREFSSAGLHTWDRYTCTEGHMTQTPETNHFPAKQQEQRNPELKKPVTTQATSARYSKGYTWYVCRSLQWTLLLLASLILGLLGFQHFPALSLPTRTALDKDRTVSSVHFEAQLSTLKPLFPSQSQELWKRTEIHLNKHLKLKDPSEPVSLILTAGRGAEKTLGCLARGLAAAFSAALNASALDIDGADKVSQDSDQVKLDIDRALREAFDGGKQAAVIHRFEELPPGSTLIFYRYCDHENAAYKNVFLTFTVLLDEELDSELSLSAVEETVQEYLKDRFVSSERTARFNQMDVDKLSGLWSRISHLILPVSAEQQIEQNGCGA